MDELPENFIDRSFAGGGAKNQGTGYGNGTTFERMKGWGGSGQDWTSDRRQSTKKETPSYLAPKTTIQKVIEHVPSADFKASDVSNLQVGQKVEHQKFGFGEVIKKEGAAHNPIATIIVRSTGCDLFNICRMIMTFFSFKDLVDLNRLVLDSNDDSSKINCPCRHDNSPAHSHSASNP